MKELRTSFRSKEIFISGNTFGRRGPPAEFYKAGHEKSIFLKSILFWVGVPESCVVKS